MREREHFTVPIAQGAPGTTEIIAAPAANTYRQIVVVSYVVSMAAAGTFKWNDGVGDLSGAMDAVQAGGVSAGHDPLIVVARARPLNIVSTVGGANGHLTYYLA